MPRIIACAGGRARAKDADSPPDDTRPCFTSTWLERGGSAEEDTLARYVVGGVPVRISSTSDRTCARYEVSPPEYDLSPAIVKVVAEVISEITSCPPEGLDLASLSVLRPFIRARAKDVVHRKLASRRSLSRGRGLLREVESLAELAAKYTAGYGVLETLLEDRAVQDVYVNAPSSQTPVHVVLRSDVLERVGQKCQTNLFIGRADLQGLVSRIKLETGMPFSEAQPVLEADIPRLGCRVTLVGPPISDEGVSLAIRKHSTEVLTLPSLIAKDSLSPLLASFLWACVLGRRAVLVAGSRGAGKTTLLGALMLEFPLTQRILLIEDTPEIPVRRMRQLGYDIQTLRFGGRQGAQGISAEHTLRVSLRMGESAIVIGEVRGSEARVLYESMRAGSAGSSVLGTIHGNSAKDEAAAGMLAMDLATYLRELSEIEHTLKTRLRPTISMMRMTAHFLGPLVLGVTFAIYVSLGSVAGGEGSLGSADSMLFVLGLFLAEMNAVVCYFVWGIEGGADVAALERSTGACLLVSQVVFASTAMLAI